MGDGDALVDASLRLSDADAMEIGAVLVGAAVGAWFSQPENLKVTPGRTRMVFISGSLRSQ